MQTCYIFDIDGTLANSKSRAEKFLKPPEGAIHFNRDEIDWVPDWDGFYENCDLDEEIVGVANVLRCLVYTGEVILFVTGRPEQYREKTLKWLCKLLDCSKEEFDIQCTLLMRKDGDHSQDYKLKREIFEQTIKNNYNVLGVFEDRDQCVTMWRQLGLQCFQVAAGDY